MSYYTIAEMEQALRDLLEGRDAQQIQAMTGLPSHRCLELASMVQTIVTRPPIEFGYTREIDQVPEDSKRVVLEHVASHYAPRGLKIQAIKYVREVLRVGLRDAKELVEQLPAFMPYRPY